MQRIDAISRAARASFRPRGTRSPTCAAPAPGIARAIAARPTTTSGFARPTAPTIASITDLQRPGQLADVGRRRQVPLLRQRVCRHPGQHRRRIRSRRHGTSRAAAITFHKDDSVRRARISAQRRMDRLRMRRRSLGRFAQGRASAASWPSRSMPTTRPIPKRIETFTTGATEFALSPDENHVAFVVHGEIFLMPTPAARRNG